MKNIKGSINDFLIMLSNVVGSNYYKQPIPSEVDIKICKFLENAASTVEKYNFLIKNRDILNNSGLFVVFAERMATLSVRNHSIEDVHIGIIALLIYSINADFRDVHLVLSILHDAVLRVGCSPDKEFEKIYGFDSAGFLQNFLRRNDKDKSISAMGYISLIDEDGFRYKRTW